MSQANTNSVDKAPFLGDLPVLGMLFRSKSYQRQETELVIIVTPYLVKPVSASQMASPTDGYRQPTDAQGILGVQSFDGKSGAKRPVPSVAPTTTYQPGAGVIAPGAAVQPADRRKSVKGKDEAPANPGFSFN
jgi:pilus assembly protein CpaC